MGDWFSTSHVQSNFINDVEKAKEAINAAFISYLIENNRELAYYLIKSDMFGQRVEDEFIYSLPGEIRYSSDSIKQDFALGEEGFAVFVEANKILTNVENFKDNLKAQLYDSSDDHLDDNDTIINKEEFEGDLNKLEHDILNDATVARCCENIESERQLLNLPYSVISAYLPAYVHAFCRALVS